MPTHTLPYVQESAKCYVMECTNELEEANSNNTALSSITKLRSQRFYSKFRTKLTIVTIASILGIFCIVAYTSHRYEYCYDELCKRTEHYLLVSMNSSVNPCENFYKFACGNWKNHHPIPNYALSANIFNEQRERTAEQISAYLSKEDSQDEPKSVHEARKLYRSCLAAEKPNEINGFKDLTAVLLEIGLPIVPSFRNPLNHFSWTVTSVRSKKIINMNYFIEFGLNYDPKNHSIKMITFSKLSSESVLHFQKISKHKKDQAVSQELISVTSSNSGKYEKEELKDKVGYKYTIEIVEYMYEKNHIPWTEETKTAFNQIFISYGVLKHKLNELSNMYYDISPILPKKITLNEFQKITDEISECQNTSSIVDWKHFIKLMFDDIKNINLDFGGRDKIILIQNEEYLKSIIKIIASTPSKVLEFYMWWKTVLKITPYTTSTLNDVIAKYNYEEYGIKKKQRNLYCAEKVHTALDYIASYFIINEDSIKQNTRKISEMVDNMQTAFVKEIETLTWMDEKTREKSLSKLKAMKKWIGYPTWMEDREILDYFYEEIVMAEDNYFNNIIEQNKRQYTTSLDDYHRVINFENKYRWPSKPLEVNAFYFNVYNGIVIPAGIFSFPFYQLGLEALNYGAIGFIVGHELTHGFDNTGKEYDEVGHLDEWWSSEPRREYERKTKCFIDQYNDFNITGLPETDNKTTLNGIRTLDENIADNGGLRIAYNAYQIYVEKNAKEKQLPILSQYNHDQLFFIAFANSWCEHAINDSFKLSLTDSHSPMFIRAQVPLMNSKEFAKTWNCPVGSPMNPKNKCQIW